MTTNFADMTPNVEKHITTNVADMTTNVAAMITNVAAMLTKCPQTVEDYQKQ